MTAGYRFLHTLLLLGKRAFTVCFLFHWNIELVQATREKSFKQNVKNKNKQN